jgi:hypothetical protein
VTARITRRQFEIRVGFLRRLQAEEQRPAVSSSSVPPPPSEFRAYSASMSGRCLFATATVVAIEVSSSPLK